MQIWYTKELNYSLTDTLEKLKLDLKTEWFGILSKIDMWAKIKSVLDEEIGDYIILWVCNPSLAYEAISARYEIWLLLPCNILVYTKLYKTYVSVIIPTVAMNMINNDIIKKLAIKVEKKLNNVLDIL